jgi:recombination protein RecA
MGDNGRDKALDTALANLTKRFGEGAIMRLGEATHLEVEIIPTGSLALDRALGVGGIPRGRVTEIYGPEGAGKTTVCQHIVAEAQKRGGTAAFIDMEHALDPAYAALCGADVENLLISQPDTGEQALEIAEALIRSGAVDVVIVDSVAALVPRAEIEGEMGDSHPGLQARLMSQALRKLSGAVKQSNTALVFTNQLREKIGVMFGNPETTSGGRALKFYATVRLDIRRINAIKEKGEVIGNRTRVRVKKNKVAPPFRVAEFDIMYDEGISKAGDLLDIAVELGVVDKRGSYYYYEDESLAQGRENAKQYLRDTPAVANKLEIIIREQLELEGAPPLLEDDEHLEADEDLETEALLEDGDEDLEEASSEGEVSEDEELEAVVEPA